MASVNILGGLLLFSAIIGIGKVFHRFNTLQVKFITEENMETKNNLRGISAFIL